jgi:hypothetical protein
VDGDQCAALKKGWTAMDELEELTYSECRALLAGGVFGRVALCTSKGAHIVPVNYSVVGEAVIFRTSAEGVVAASDWNVSMAFEVDHVDYDELTGWSVVAAGCGEWVEDPKVLGRIKRTWDPDPWASGERLLYVRIAWSNLTGRRLGRRSTRQNELPGRRLL